MTVDLSSLTSTRVVRFGKPPSKYQSSRRAKCNKRLQCSAESASFPSPSRAKGNRNYDFGQKWQQGAADSKARRPPITVQAERPQPSPVTKKRPEKGESVSSSLFVDFGSLPPDGKSVTEQEETCNPMEQHCKTAIHVWEQKCRKCYGTGILTQSSRRGGRHSCTCLACHGLGYVRQASADRVPDFSNGAVTIGRQKFEE